LSKRRAPDHEFSKEGRLDGMEGKWRRPDTQETATSGKRKDEELTSLPKKDWDG